VKPVSLTSRLCLAALLCVLAPPAGRARAQMRFTSIQFTQQADARVFDPDGTLGPPCRDLRTPIFPIPPDTVPPTSFADTADCDAASVFSVSTTASVDYRSDVDAVGNVTSVSFTARLTGDTNAPEPTPPTGGTSGQARASGRFVFSAPRSTVGFHITVALGPGAEFLDGATVIVGGTSVSGSLSAQNGNVVTDTLPRDGALPRTHNLSLEVSLLLNPAGRTTVSKAGEVTVTITFSSAPGACCLAGGGCTETSLADCSGLGDFQGEGTTCGAADCTPDEDVVDWVNGTGGDFDVAGNWDPASVPGEAQTARFFLPGLYFVTGGDRRVRRMTVTNGTVNFQGGPLQLLDISLATPSVALAEGRLNILAGAAVLSSHVSVGSGGSRVAGLGVSGLASLMRSTGRVTIGDASPGELTVAEEASLESAEARIGESAEGDASVEGASSSWATGNIAVGTGALGALRIEGGGKVRSGEGVLGLTAPASGLVEVIGSDATGTASLWQLSGNLRVGAGGPGSLVIGDGGSVEVGAGLLVVGDQAPGAVSLTTGSGLQALLLDVGGNVGGTVAVTDGATVLTIQTRLGPGDGEGNVTVTGAESRWNGSLLTVRRGTLRVADAAVVESARGVVAGPAANVLVSGAAQWEATESLEVGSAEGPGTITLDGGLLNVGPEGLFVGPTGTLAGRGVVLIPPAPGGVPFAMTLFGTISPDVTFSAIPSTAAARVGGLRPAAITPAEGELVIDGSLSLGASAVLRIPVAGAGRSGVLHVTGDLARGGTLEFVFVDGYLPKTGDLIEGLRVDGAMAGDFAAVRLRGVADDFLFDLDTTGGVTRLTARSDARPAGCADGADNDGDGLVDCADPGCGGSTECAAPGGEICGNCLDDDGNGQADFDDPACCGGAAPSALRVRRGAIKPRGPASRLALDLTFDGAGDPSTQDVFLQLGADGAAPVLCARLPAGRLTRKGERFKFTDRAQAVKAARGLDVAALRLRKQGRATLKAKARAASLVPPPPGMLRLTVGFHDAERGEGENRCASGVRGFARGRKGSLAVSGRAAAGGDTARATRVGRGARPGRAAR
jgi:T5SS/PEP-CTERM-associated repeat protein